jgi:hypothetical protein
MISFLFVEVEVVPECLLVPLFPISPVDWLIPLVPWRKSSIGWHCCWWRSDCRSNCSTWRTWALRRRCSRSHSNTWSSSWRRCCRSNCRCNCWYNCNTWSASWWRSSRNLWWSCSRGNSWTNTGLARW